ncbi:hypothetical protein K5D43_21370 [Pseudomonas cichorii]|nr:hypothetical protein [Pseudomonas cichorii]MBX8557030.1 hypothetical protein [Pseudomonas cichorii]
MSIQPVYRCGGCKKSFATFSAASACCTADYIECPLSDLSSDAELGPGKAYSYGTVFTGGWEIVHNHGVFGQPVMVYALPPLVNRAMEHLCAARYETGQLDAKAAMRNALGLK